MQQDDANPVIDEAGHKSRMRSPAAVADLRERAALRPFARRIAEWHVRAAHLEALVAHAYDPKRAYTARHEARRLMETVKADAAKLAVQRPITGSTGSYREDVRKSLATLLTRLETL